MTEFCTCGAQLVPDSLFCHKCGKPQRELVVPNAAPNVAGASEGARDLPVFVVTAPSAPPGPQPLPPNFRNPVALRIALLVAIIATLLSFIPYLNWLGAGYFAAFFYRRRTGSLLTLRAGVHMGWITGVLMFTIMAFFFVAFLVLFNTSGGIELFQAQFKNAADPRIKEMLRILQNRWDVAMLLTQLFVFMTCLSMAGGALGAKLAGRGN